MKDLPILCAIYLHRFGTRLWLKNKDNIFILLLIYMSAYYKKRVQTNILFICPNLLHIQSADISSR